jgi:hypothetical protein
VPQNASQRAMREMAPNAACGAEKRGPQTERTVLFPSADRQNIRVLS